MSGNIRKNEAEMMTMMNAVNSIGAIGTIEKMGKISMMKHSKKQDAENTALVAPNCNCSVFTMATVACGLLFCLGIIVYALIAG